MVVANSPVSWQCLRSTCVALLSEAATIYVKLQTKFYNLRVCVYEREGETKFRDAWFWDCEDEACPSYWWLLTESHGSLWIFTMFAKKVRFRGANSLCSELCSLNFFGGDTVKKRIRVEGILLGLILKVSQYFCNTDFSRLSSASQSSLSRI